MLCAWGNSSFTWTPRLFVMKSNLWSGKGHIARTSYHVFDYCSYLVMRNAEYLHSRWRSSSNIFRITAFSHVWSTCSFRLSRLVFCVWSKSVLTNETKSHQYRIFQFWPEICICWFFPKVGNFSEAARVKLIMENWCMNESILSWMRHQAFWAILGLSALNQFYMMCHWYSQASRICKSIEVSLFDLKAFQQSAISSIFGNSKIIVHNKIFTTREKLWSSEVFSEGLWFCQVWWVN